MILLSLIRTVLFFIKKQLIKFDDFKLDLITSKRMF